MAADNISMDLKFDELMTYQEVLDYCEKHKRLKHLLMGNGFSIGYNHKIFSYNALYDFVEKLEDQTLSKLFKVVNTKNFEAIMSQLDNFIEIAEAFDTDGGLIESLKEANLLLQPSLINAVSEL